MQQTTHLKANDTTAFIGDSITVADRNRQAHRPLGGGYVPFVGNLLLARNGADLEIVNTGISGDAVIEVEDRWRRDCLAHCPNGLHVLVGINDVRRRAMEQDGTKRAARPAEFDVTYEQLLEPTAKIFSFRRFSCLKD